MGSASRRSRVVYQIVEELAMFTYHSRLATTVGLARSIAGGALPAPTCPQRPRTRSQPELCAAIQQRRRWSAREQFCQAPQNNGRDKSGPYDCLNIGG